MISSSVQYNRLHHFLESADSLGSRCLNVIQWNVCGTRICPIRGLGLRMESVQHTCSQTAFMIPPDRILATVDRDDSHTTTAGIQFGKGLLPPPLLPYGVATTLIATLLGATADPNTYI